MNFITEFKKGQEGKNKGLYMGAGLHNLSNVINGVQKERIYGIAAAPKVGKSTFVDYAFLMQPYLYHLETGDQVEWIYYSFELSRVSKEFDVAAFFIFNDFGIKEIQLQGETKEGKNTIGLSSDYLRGRIQNDNGEIIRIEPQILEYLKEVYENRIIPIFGEYDEQGQQIKPGLVTFIEQKDNPTGMYNFLKDKARSEGEFVTATYGKSKRIVGYHPYNPEKYTIIITDHLRKLIPERGFTMKQTVDKYIEYSVELRNWCGYTFAHIIHLNRKVTNEYRMTNSGDLLYPNSDDIKDTGNLSEEADHVFTLFNPNDSRYRLDKHFGKRIKDNNLNTLYPNMRTIHLVESRHVSYPEHFRVNMFGGYKAFEVLNL